MASHESSLQALEVKFFRALNRVIEPLVRKGFGAPRLVPTGLIVLETLGRVSGRWRSTPLVATRFGPYVLVSTFRGRRSQWMRNLQAEPTARLWLSGKARKAHALVLSEGKHARLPADWPQALRALVRLLVPLTGNGWAFALLAPVTPVARTKSSAAAKRARPAVTVGRSRATRKTSAR